MRDDLVRRVCFVLVAAGVLVAAAVAAEEVQKAVVVLDTSGYWRVHYTLSPAPIHRGGGEGLVKVKTLTGETPAPAADWTGPDFDDRGWTRIPNTPFPPHKWYRTPDELMDAGFTAVDYSSPSVGRMVLRGKFEVTDPGRVKGLRLWLAYRGGVVVYVNGRELTRAHLPEGPVGTDTLAGDYPIEAYVKPDGSLLDGNPQGPDMDRENQRRYRLHIRELAGVAVPAEFLRRGVNVLAVDIHRSPYNEVLFEKLKGVANHLIATFVWSSCGLVTARLEADAAEGVVPNVVRPKGFRVWNSDLLSPDYDLDWPDRGEGLGPVRVVGAPGGRFSGKVVVGSDETIRALKAAVGDFVAAGGNGRIAASRVEVRYALPTGWEATSVGRFGAQVDLFDALSETPLAEIPVRVKEKARGEWVRPGQPEPVFGAVTPVWVTVSVPEDAASGDYESTLTITAEGVPAARVPLRLWVSGWKLPPPGAFHTVVDLIQSPESVALQYDVPPYGEKHWPLLARSFDRLGLVGNWTLYVPLISRTNQGNEQSMVRWVRRPDGTTTHDFTVFDRYLETAEKHMGKPRIICLYVWDLFVGGYKSRHQKLIHEGIVTTDAAGVPVSLVDEATGEVSTHLLPAYGAPGSEALWRPVAEGVRARLRRRGLENAMMLGLASDGRPAQEIVEFLAKVFPGVPWMRQGHQEWKELGTTGAAVGYQATVVPVRFVDDPDAGKFSCLGWRRPDCRTMYFRSSHPTCPVVLSRLLGEFNIQGWQRGFGRIGLDFWPVLKDTRGRRVGTLIGRFPQSAWRQLDSMVTAFVPPGPDGAYATTKLELMREGLQECEARVFIEQALTDEALRGRLAADLVGRCEAVLAGRGRALLVNLENQRQAGFEGPLVLQHPQLTGAEYGFNYTGTSASIFFQWYAHSGWQERSERLYAAAAEVARALEKP